MKKQYQKPVVGIAMTNTSVMLLAGSGGGVASGSSVGDDYTESDVSYGRRHRSNLWDDDEE